MSYNRSKISISISSLLHRIAGCAEKQEQENQKGISSPNAFNMRTWRHLGFGVKQLSGSIHALAYNLFLSTQRVGQVKILISLIRQL